MSRFLFTVSIEAGGLDDARVVAEDTIERLQGDDVEVSPTLVCVCPINKALAPSHYNGPDGKRVYITYGR